MTHGGWVTHLKFYTWNWTSVGPTTCQRVGSRVSLWDWRLISLFTLGFTLTACWCLEDDVA